jgi:hypothetical protein
MRMPSWRTFPDTPTSNRPFRSAESRSEFQTCSRTKNTVNYSSFPRKREPRTSVGAVTPWTHAFKPFEEISRRSSTRHPGAGRGPSRRSMDPVIVRARHCSCLRSPEYRSMGPGLRGCNPIGIDEHGHDFDMSLSRCPGESRDPCFHK